LNTFYNEKLHVNDSKLPEWQTGFSFLQTPSTQRVSIKILLQVPPATKITYSNSRTVTVIVLFSL
jgi:hypothetical protein